MAKLMFVFLVLSAMWEVGAKASMASKTMENEYLGNAG